MNFLGDRACGGDFRIWSSSGHRVTCRWETPTARCVCCNHVWSRDPSKLHVCICPGYGATHQNVRHTHTHVTHTHTTTTPLSPRRRVWVRRARMCGDLAPLDRGDHLLLIDLQNVSPSGQGRALYRLPTLTFLHANLCLSIGVCVRVNPLWAKTFISRS